MTASHKFPETQRTWIVDRIGEGEDREVRQHLMAVYAQPLQQLARTRFRMDAGLAMDLVHGFFASRLGRSDYLLQWDKREMRLRGWLWNGLCFFLKEERRANRRFRTVQNVPDAADPSQKDPAEDLDRAFARALVQEARVRARHSCEADGFVKHWTVFTRRYEGEEALTAIAGDLGVSPDRALVMLRAPRLRFRQAITELLLADGVSAADMPRALRKLQEAIE